MFWAWSWLAVQWQAGEHVGWGCLLCQSLEMGVLGLWRGEAPLGAGEVRMSLEDGEERAWAWMLWSC